MITKQQILDKEIIEFPDFLTPKEQDDFWHHANYCEYNYIQRGEVLGSDVSKNMTHHFDPEMFIKLDLWKRMCELVDEPLYLPRVHINFTTPFSYYGAHRDNSKDDMSVLISINSEWNREWEGYCVFYKSLSSTTILKTVIPEPGKAIFFNGSEYHKPLAPSVRCPFARFMLVLKTSWSPGPTAQAVTTGTAAFSAENK